MPPGSLFVKKIGVHRSRGNRVQYQDNGCRRRSFEALCTGSRAFSGVVLFSACRLRSSLQKIPVAFRFLLLDMTFVFVAVPHVRTTYTREWVGSRGCDKIPRKTALGSSPFDSSTPVTIRLDSRSDLDTIISSSDTRSACSSNALLTYCFFFEALPALASNVERTGSCFRSRCRSK